MHEHVLYQQINLLKRHGIVQEEQVDEAVRILKGKYWHSKIADIWNTDDIQEVAETLEVEITEDGAREILLRLQDNFDSEVGITHFVIETNIRQYVLEKE